MRSAGSRASGSTTCSKRPASASPTNDAVVTDDGDAQLPRPRPPRQPGGAPPDRSGHPAPATASACCSTSRAETYVAMLAVMKVNAAYVPLDAAFPVERIRFIIGDAEIKAIVSMSSFAERLARARGARRSFSTPPSARSTRRRPSRLTDVRAAGRSALLHHLHLGHDRQPEGRRHRARQHLQLRARRRRALRLSCRATASIRA